MMGMPGLCMGDGDPAEDLGQFSTMSRLEEEMSVIGHQTIGGDADFSGPGFRRESSQRQVVSELLKEQQSSHSTVQYVIGEISSSKAWAPWHTEDFRSLFFPRRTVDRDQRLVSFVAARNKPLTPASNDFLETLRGTIPLTGIPLTFLTAYLSKGRNLVVASARGSDRLRRGGGGVIHRSQWRRLSRFPKLRLARRASI